jgi:hypothetical protein
MPGHHNQIELSLRPDRGKVTEDPLDVRALTRLLEHSGRGIKSTQPSRMTGLPGTMQQRTGPAADIKHGPRGHHHWQVEIEVAQAYQAISTTSIQAARYDRVPEVRKNCIAVRA